MEYVKNFHSSLNEVVIHLACHNSIIQSSCSNPIDLLSLRPVDSADVKHVCLMGSI
jgi:hypothetical protein